MNVRPLRIILAGWLVAAAVPAGAADLMAVYRDAQGYDAQYAAARAALEAGRERLPQGLAGLLPSIGLGVQTAWNDSETALRRSGVPKSGSEYNTNGWSLSLTQPVFRWQNWVAYNQAELSVALSEAQFDAARADLIVRTAQAYFDVLLAQDALATAQSQKTAIAEQLEAAKRNFEVGTTTVTDTHEAQAAYDLVIAQEIAAQSDLSVRQHALQALIGKDVPGLKRLRTGITLEPPQPADMGRWVTLAETESPVVRQAQVAHEIAGREVERQRAGHLPTVDLVATRSYGAQGFASSVGSGVETNTTTIGLQLAVPLYAGGYVSSKSREAAALRDKSAADLDNARRGVALGARQAYLGVTSGLAQVRAFEAALVSSQSALDSNKLGYEVGVRINIDVLNAQQQLFSTRRDLAVARYNTITNHLRLKAAAGSLREEDLQEVNAALAQ